VRILAGALVAGIVLALLVPRWFDHRAARSTAVQAAQLEQLRMDIDLLRDSLARRAAGDTLLVALHDDPGSLVVLTRTTLIEELMAWAAVHYLRDVELHVSPNVVVRESEEVRVNIGIARPRAGQWDLALTILDIRAQLHGGTPATRTLDSARFAITMPVTVSGGSGAAHVDFRWNAAALASVACRSFSVEERFTGTVGRSTHTLDGFIRLEARDERIVAVPDFSRSRLLVRPEPTAASWRRVRSLLDHQDHIFRCGLAINPERMQNMLGDLLRAGFRFNLPANLFPELALPGVLREQVEIDGHAIAAAARPLRLRLTPEVLWYSVEVRVGDTDHETRTAH
jgi:hypothetical protein